APAGEEDLREVAPAGPRRGRLGRHLGMTAAAIPSERATPRVAILPWYVAATLVAATSAKVGIIWDISWHRSIGRDTFWTPAHMAIYLGGVLAGLSCGWLALQTTFAGPPEARAASVRFWGFRSEERRVGKECRSRRWPARNKERNEASRGARAAG